MVLSRSPEPPSLRVAKPHSAHLGFVHSTAEWRSLGLAPLFRRRDNVWSIVSERVHKPRDKGDVPDDPLSRMRHSASHVMADAVRRLRPHAKGAIGPSIESGFYYHVHTEPLTPQDAEQTDARMRPIITHRV